VSSNTDNDWFEENYKAACAVIVKASCKFLGTQYWTEQELDTDRDRHIAELESENKALRERMTAIKDYIANA
ncbi:MAG: hypothetical protein RR528_09850, partial [Angelakisella sp.]